MNRATGIIMVGQAVGRSQSAGADHSGFRTLTTEQAIQWRIQDDVAYIKAAIAQNDLIDGCIRCLGHRYRECSGYRSCDAPMRLSRSYRAFCRECQKGLSDYEKEVRWRP